VSFGRDLQLERENRGVSLEELAQGTKVPSRFLCALEADNFSGLPGGVFNKGIVSSYCRHLGIAEESWLARFAASTHTSSDERDWAVFAENVKRNRVQMGTGMRQRWWGVLLLLIVLVALAWVTWHYVIQPGVRPYGVFSSSMLRLPENPGSGLQGPGAC
jgi:cytoskeleton protein RodZ